MKVICNQTDLKQAGLLSEKTVGHNLTLPILNSVLITTHKNMLNFSSTNLEMSLEINIPADIKKEGKVALPAKLFSSFISSIPSSEKIQLEKINNTLVITTSNSSTTIKGYNVEDFPILPKIKEKTSFTLSVSDFVLGLKSVYYAASFSEIKPEINSIFVYIAKSLPLTFVATDSFRLAEKTIPYGFSKSFSFLIPYRSVIEMIRIFETIEDDLKINLDDNNLVLETKKIKFTSRLIEGSFPDYKQFIPVKFTNTVTVDKRYFHEALKTANMFCGKLNEVRIKIYASEDFVEIQTNNPDLGEHIVKVAGKTEGDDLTIIFNHRYLADCLSSINSDQILLKFSGEGKPLLVTGLDDVSFRYVIMPMKNL
jgi:DNA polymerase-3 subunit beta